MSKAIMGAGAVIIAAVTTLAAPTAVQAALYCGISWGSLEKAGPGEPVSGSGSVVNVRAGEHDCYDRVVIDATGAVGSWDIQYVPAVPYQALDGTVPLRGGAFLDVMLRTPTYDVTTGTPTFTPDDSAELVDVAGWRTLRQVA